MCGPQFPPNHATVSDRHVNSSPMTNTQSSGVHIVEINSNGAQTILYWLLGLFVLFVILAGIRVWCKHRHDPATRLRKKEERKEMKLVHLEMEAEQDHRQTQELGEWAVVAMVGATLPRTPHHRPVNTITRSRHPHQSS